MTFNDENRADGPNPGRSRDGASRSPSRRRDRGRRHHLRLRRPDRNRTADVKNQPPAVTTPALAGREGASPAPTPARPEFAGTQQETGERQSRFGGAHCVQTVPALVGGGSQPNTLRPP